MDLKMDNKMIPAVLAVIIVVIAAAAVILLTGGDEEKPRFDVTITEYTDAQHGAVIDITDAEGKDVSGTVNVNEDYVYTLTIKSKGAVVDAITFQPEGRVLLSEENRTYDAESGLFVYTAKIRFVNGDAFEMKMDVSFRDPDNKLTLDPVDGVEYTVGDQPAPGEMQFHDVVVVKIKITSSERPVYISLGEVPEGAVSMGTAETTETEGEFVTELEVTVKPGRDVTLKAEAMPTYHVDIPDYSEPNHEGVKIQVTDAEGNPVTQADLRDDVSYNVTITSVDEVIIGLDATPSDRVTVSDFASVETEDGFKYTASIKISKGTPVTVGFTPKYSTSTVTLGPYSGAEGENLTYTIDGEAVTDKVVITEDTEIVLTLVGKDRPTGFTVTSSVPDSMTVVKEFSVTGDASKGYTSTVTVRITLGTDLTITPSVVFEMDVTVTPFDSQGHSTTITVTKDGEPVDGTVTLSRGDVLDVRVDSDTKVNEMTVTPSDRVRITGWTGTGNTYTCKLVVSYGEALTVGFALEYAIYDLTLEPYDKDGVTVEYLIDGKPASGTVKILKDTEVTVVMTSPRVLESMKVTGADPGELKQSPSGSKIVATMTVTAKTGADRTLSVEPVFASGDYYPAFLGIIAPEGVEIVYNNLHYRDGDIIAMTSHGDVQVFSGASDVAYIVTWPGKEAVSGKVSEDGKINISIGGQGEVGTLRVGIVDENTSSPEYTVHYPDSIPGIAEVDYKVGSSSQANPSKFTRDVTVDVTMKLTENVKAVYVFVTFDDGTTRCIRTDVTPEMIETSPIVAKIDLTWEHGDARVSIVPVFDSDNGNKSTISMDIGDNVEVEYGGNTFQGKGSLNMVTGNAVSFTTAQAGTLNYTFSWGDRTITGSSTSFGGNKVTMPKELSDMAMVLGDGNLTVTFTPMLLNA